MTAHPKSMTAAEFFGTDDLGEQLAAVAKSDGVGDPRPSRPRFVSAGGRTTPSTGDEMIRRGRTLPAVAVAALIAVLSGCGLQAFNWHTDIVGGEVQFAGVEDAKSDIHAARSTVTCRNHVTGATYQQRGNLVDVDSGVGLDHNTGTFWSVVTCGIGDARVSNVGIVVVRRG